MEIEVPEPLANADPDAKRVINVVVINYLSSKDGTYVKQAKDWGVTDSSGQLVENLLISEMNKYMFVMNIQAKNCIEEGARFRGFKDPDSKPYFGIKVIKCFNIYKEYYNYKAEHPDWEPDFFKAFDLIGVKDLVEKMAQKRFGGIVKLGCLNRPCRLRGVLVAQIIVGRQTIFYLFIIKLMSFTMELGFTGHTLNQYTAEATNMKPNWLN